MAALFKRKDKTTIAELEEYYANQSTNSSTKAWGMAILSLILTIAIIVALFFGGRWLYRTLVDNNNENPAETSQAGNNDVNLPSIDGALPGESNSTNDGETSGDVVIGTDTTSEGVIDDGAAVTTRPNTGTTAGQQTSNTSEDLPNTGPGETVVALLATTGVLGYFMARRRYQ